MNDESKIKLELYKSLFKGRQDVYARYWEKNGKSGYSPAYNFNWNEFNQHRAKGGTLNNFENKKLIPFTDGIYINHLSGNELIGIYPLLDDNTSYFLAVDFDDKNWEDDSKKFVEESSSYGLPAYLEISKSGNGAHVWIFFEDKYLASRIRAIVFHILRKVFNVSEFTKDISFDRLFPNQDFLSKGQIGNLIALPLNMKYLNHNTTCFVDPDTFLMYEDQWKFLESVKKISPKKLDGIYDEIFDRTTISNNYTESNLTITVDEQIYLDKNYIPEILKSYLREQLNFTNSEYIIKHKLGLSVYQIEKFFKLIQEENEKVLIPRGFLNELINFCEEHKINFVINDRRKDRPIVNFKNKFDLYDYQEKAIDSLRKETFGVLVAPPGSGKTVMGLKLLADIGQPALIIVHRKQLLEQWKERIESFLKIPKKDIGVISGTKKKIGKEITIATIQTLSKFPDITALKNKFGIIIVDECHHIPAKSFRETITRFRSKYLYGLTATPKRKHNDEKLIYFYIGEILHSVDIDYKKESRIGNLKVNIEKTDLELPFDLTIDNFQLLLKIITFDTNRNEQIALEIFNKIKTNRKVLVLTDRKDHVDILNLYLNSKSEVITLTGDDSKTSRDLKLEQILQGHFQVIIATSQLFGEGIDIDTIDCLFLVFPFSFEGKLIQYIGRIQRTKKDQLLIDYHDKKIPMLDKMFKKRLRYYKKINAL